MTSLCNKYLAIILCLILLFTGFSSVSASTLSPTRIVTGFVSTCVTKLMKWIWSLQTSSNSATLERPVIKYESGYNVETVFDGSKLGIEPYNVEVFPNGELLILDSVNSNLYTISSSLSLYSRPKLVAGSAEGYTGHVDGKHREAKMNHPKGIAVDNKGNIYVADTENMAIRKISDAGVSTIAGGKWGHRDGPSEEAKFSNDFDVVYVGSSCSLLVIDRGNRAIREIQLRFDDCAYQYESSFPLGIIVLISAALFGYLLALLQRRVGSTVSSQNTTSLKHIRPPLIQTTEDDLKNQEETFLTSLLKLITTFGTSAMEIIGSFIPGFGNKPVSYQYQESFEIPKEEEPPLIEIKTPTPKKTYAFMSEDAENKLQQQLRLSRVIYSGLDLDLDSEFKKLENEGDKF